MKRVMTVAFALMVGLSLSMPAWAQTPQPKQASSNTQSAKDKKKAEKAKKKADAKAAKEKAEKDAKAKAAKK